MMVLLQRSPTDGHNAVASLPQNTRLGFRAVARPVDASLVDGDRDAHRLRYGGLSWRSENRYDREGEVDEGREEKDHLEALRGTGISSARVPEYPVLIHRLRFRSEEIGTLPIFAGCRCIFLMSLNPAGES